MTALLALLFLDVALAKKPVLAPPPPEKPVVVQPTEAPRAPGSLWSEPDARVVMGIGTGHHIGDLITVRIAEYTATQIQGETTATRDSATEASLGALLGAETSIPGTREAMGGQVKIAGGGSSDFTGAGGTKRGSQLATTLTCEVIEVLPAGNLKIWGYKQVRVNREIQYVVLTAVVRARDIQIDNTVGSDLLANAKIEVTGTGVVGDKQGPGVATRILDHVSPF